MDSTTSTNTTSDTDAAQYTPKPGDLCVILEGGLVQHYRCDQYADGVITQGRRIIRNGRARA